MRDQKAELDILKNINKIVSQKSLADELGYSAGKINYVLKALIEKKKKEYDELSQELDIMILYWNNS